MMPAVLVMEVFDSVHRTLSMSVPFKSENLVGRVFLGKIPASLLNLNSP